MSAIERCVSEPVSWLRLERYHLGELADGERDAVARHLAMCAACGACLAGLEAEDAVALPALSLPVAPGARRDAERRHDRRPLWIAGLGALAAAAVVVFVLRRPAGDGVPVVASTARVKGGDVAFALVRDDGQRLDETDGVFVDGDRFKAVVTCPASEHGAFDLVVFDQDGASFPLDAPRGLACGNDVPLPGAFRLTGRSRERVCIVWSDEGPVDRARLSSPDAEFAAHSACKELAPRGD